MMFRLRAKERRKPEMRQRVRVTGQGIGVVDLVFEDGHCVEAPLRLTAALGKTDRAVGFYCKRRGWKMEVT